MSRRDEVLRAVREAGDLVRNHPVGNRSSFDLIGLVEKLEIPVMFRPLDGLQGAAVSVGEQTGALIHSGLPRTLQRFTLAHELGHIRLGHKTQFDEDVGTAHRSTERGGRPPIETAADTFAGRLLGPLHLIQENANRQGWSPEDLQDPEKIYQLGLRLGMSFKATCWALHEHDVLPWRIANDYANRQGIVMEVKQRLLAGTDLPHSRSDVWLLTGGDEGLHLEASLRDLFIVQLEEKAASGYLWDLGDAPLSLQVRGRQTKLPSEFGSPSEKTIHLTFDEPGLYTVSLEHKRPWNGELADQINISIDNFGREEGGFPRQVRQSALSGATA